MQAAIKHTTVDGYLSWFPEAVQGKLEKLRSAIKKAAPGTTELISYNMPAYKQHGILVYFAGYKNHIGFYPTSSPIRMFKDELTQYKVSKGAIQFPIDQPLPLGLITKIVKFRVKEDREKALAKHLK
jgi:uncharacterized protein YdhG (YjbR/CyaY superfamily)